MTAPATPPKRKRPASFVRRWCLEYLLDYNAAAATLRAFPASSPKSARQRGHQILHREDTQLMLAEMEAEFAEQAGIKLHRLLAELHAVAHSSVDHFEIDADGRVLVKVDAPENAVRAVASIKRRRREIPRKDDEPIVEIDTELRLWSKPEALRLGMQHVGGLVDKTETTHKTPDGKPLPIEVRVVYEELPPLGEDGR